MMAQTTTSSIDSLLARLSDRINSALAAQIDDANLPANLAEATCYAVLGGGKRLRPILTLLCCEAVDGQRERGLPAAVAVEFIHAFSLVHDDLPALDNDDLRRGRPTVHKTFGEPMAILVGDTLQTLAFDSLLDSDPALIGELALATRRMIAGQVYDTLGGFPDDITTDHDRLNLIHRNKTGALIRSACRMGAIAGRASDEQQTQLTVYGEAIGLMFQIVDDLLDVTQSASHIGKATNKDSTAGKITFPGVYGIEWSQKQVRRLEVKACEAVESMEGATPSSPLHELARLLAARTK